MKKRIWFTILTILLTAAVIVLPMIQAYLTEQPSPTPVGVEKSKHNIVQQSEDKKTPQKDDNTGLKDATVNYFVTLTEPAIIDTYLSLGSAYPNIRTLLLSEAGKSYADAVKRSQAVAKASIKKLVPSSDFTDSRTVSALWNGVTFRAPFSTKEKIAKINGVSGVYILSDEWYCLDEPSAAENTVVPDTSDNPVTEVSDNTVTDNTPNIPSGTEENDLHYALSQPLQKAYREQIHANSETTAAYQGQGTLIAVLDSEFDTADPVFAQAPENGVWTRSLLTALSQNIRFNITETQQAENCYVSPKIVYAYDYAENDHNTSDVSLYHGTLTAAIAAGHNGETDGNAYQGVASQAQLALMKVASVRTANGRITIETDALLAALDDAVKLGADAVNLSFGSESVSATDNFYRTAFQKLQKAGIAVLAAAGNSGYNGQALGQPVLSGDIFYKTENTLAAMTGITPVGAVQNTRHVRHFFTIGDTKVYYRNLSDIPLTDILHYAEPVPAEESSLIEESSAVSDVSVQDSSGQISSVEESSEITENPVPEEPQQDNTYYYINHYDRSTVLHSTDIEGRLLILEGSQTENLSDALQTAIDKGAAAIALMNGTDTDIPVQYGLPFVVLEGNYTALLRPQPSGSYQMDLNDELTENTSAVHVSGFTSYGSPLPSSVSRLMAPGEDVYAAVSDNTRSLLTGTSAAAPGVTGAYAVLKQYVSGLPMTDSLTAADKSRIVDSLLKSTAEPLMASDTLYVSPRLQGFGLLQLDKALSVQAYLSDTSQNSKAVLLSIGEDGTCQFTVTLHNLAETSRSYLPSLVLQTDSLQDNINLLSPRSLTTETTVQFAVGKTSAPILTTGGNSSIEITVTLTINPAMLATLQEQFPSGCYIDGYLLLTPMDGSPRLNMPLTGFYPPDTYSPFDHTVYDEDESLTGLDSSLTAAAYHIGSYRSCPLLSYKEQLLYSQEALRTVTDDNSYGIAFILPDIYPLCDLYDYTITIYSSTGQTLYSENYGTISAYREKDRRPFEKLLNGNKNLRECFLKLTGGTYRYEMSARMQQADGSLSSVFRKTYSFVVDTQKPSVLSTQTQQQNGRTILSLTAQDSYGLQGFTLYAATYDSRKKQYDYIDSLDSMIQAGYLAENAYTLIGQQTNEDGSQTFRYDVTNLQRELRKLAINTETWSSYCLDERIAFKAIDNAYNASSVGMADVIEFGSASFCFTDQDGHPAKGISVTIDHVTVMSDQDGIARFDHLAPNYYHAVLQYPADHYSIETTDYLVPVLPAQLHYTHEQTVTALQPYIPEENSVIPDTVSQTQTISSASSPTDDDPLYAFFFVGTFLTICIILFLFRKARE